MPVLLIRFEDGVGWSALVANTPLHYPFEGGAADVEGAQVQIFAEHLRTGGNIADCFEWHVDPPEDVERVLREQLFASTDQVMLDGRLIYGTIGEDEFLIDVLEEVGEAILAVMA